MRLLFVTAGIACLLLVAVLLLEAPQVPPSRVSADAPQNATYEIEGISYTLSNGVSERSSGREVVRMFGEPVWGDVDGDYDDDALMLLVYESGGSGTFYYLGVAIDQQGTFEITKTAFIGDRIAPQSINVRNRVIHVSYAERKDGEPFTTPPSLGVTRYFLLERGELVEKPVRTEELVLSGYVTWGGEVRAFRPCGEGSPEYWLRGESPALGAIRETYERLVGREAPPYTPLFATISGTIGSAPDDGFGADYAYGITVQTLLTADRIGTCASDAVVLTAPLAGAAIESPLAIKGYARGAWLFEGDMPVTLVDWDGLIVAEGYVSATRDWMTEDLVPFEGVLTFTRPSDDIYSRRGTLIVKKDNASGDPQHDAALEIPVVFK